MEYLTPEDYETAALNGIERGVVYHRFYTYGWDRERAITVPVGFRGLSERQQEWESVKEKAGKLGITKEIFYNRRNTGWTFEEASSCPNSGIGRSRRKQQVVIPNSIYELADKNGIKRSTLRNRIYTQRWNHYRAATEPVNKVCNWREQA